MLASAENRFSRRRIFCPEAFGLRVAGGGKTGQFAMIRGDLERDPLLLGPFSHGGRPADGRHPGQDGGPGDRDARAGPARSPYQRARPPRHHLPERTPTTSTFSCRRSGDAPHVHAGRLGGRERGRRRSRSSMGDVGRPTSCCSRTSAPWGGAPPDGPRTARRGPRGSSRSRSRRASRRSPARAAVSATSATSA